VIRDAPRRELFDRAVAIFFAFVLLGLGIATLVNAPLAYDGAFFFFRVLDTHQFAADHGRLINLPMQLPVLIATRFTDNLHLLRLLYCAPEAAIPLLGLGLAWLVCKSQRPSLFIWPAMSICVAALPGHFSFHSEAKMVVTLLWPVLLAVLSGASAILLSLLAIVSVVAAYSHPTAVILLAFIVSVAIACAIVRPQSRRRSVGFALALGILLLVRVLTPLDSYEGQALSFATVANSFNDSVKGWPLLAIALAVLAGLSCLWTVRPSRAYLLGPLILAGTALAAWAFQPAEWASCEDYRYWIAPVSMLFMTGATIDQLRPRGSPESQLQEFRLYAVPIVGAIFLLVLSIQSLQWGLASRRLMSEVENAEPGCVSSKTIASIRNTALDHWSVTFYVLELQDREPETLLLPNQLACELFVLNGNATLVNLGSFNYLRPRGAGWFDFQNARSRTGKPER
jgi:hypothetical protein